MLTKGLVALVIPFVHARPPYARHARPQAVDASDPASGILLFLLLAAPWFIIVSSRNPEFARFFFIHEHFERFLTTEHRRTGAWWYFLPMLALGLLPWTGVFLWRLRASWREASATPIAFAWIRFCLIWSAFIFVFFSVSGSKLPSYILPIFPAAGAGARRRNSIGCRHARSRGGGADRVDDDRPVARQHPRLGATCRPFSDARTPRVLYEALGPMGQAGARHRRRRVRDRLDRIPTRTTSAARRPASSPCRVATMLAMQAVYTGSDVFRATRSAADFVTVLENANNPPYDRSAPFFQVRMYDQTLPFYLERTTTLGRLSRRAGARPRRRAGARHRPRSRLDRALAIAVAGIRIDGARYACRIRRCRHSDARDRVRRAPRARRASLTSSRMTASAFVFLMTGVLLNAGGATAAEERHEPARRHHAERRQLDSDAVADGVGRLFHRRRRVLCRESRSSGSSGCRACRCRSPIRCCRSATSSTRSPRITCSARRVTVQRWLGIGFIIVGVYLVARS